MKIAEYKKLHPEPMRQVTLCLLVRGDEVLLAMKKRGFGAGKWNGVGGKLNPGEDLETAARREAEEEIGVKMKELRMMGTLGFYFPTKPEWSQEVVVFSCESWEGDPVETGEMAPKWYNKKKLPFDRMWWDDELWMPKVLAGKTIRAEFMMEEADKPGEYEIREIGQVDVMRPAGVGEGSWQYG